MQFYTHTHRPSIFPVCVGQREVQQWKRETKQLTSSFIFCKSRKLILMYPGSLLQVHTHGHQGFKKQL